MNNKSDRGMKSGWLKCLWYMLLAFLLTGYIVVPFFCTVIKAFETENGYGIGNIQEYLSNPNQLRVIGNTVLLGAASVLVCGAVGIALALYMTFLAGREKKAVHILLLSPMMIPGVIVVIAFNQLYGESGIITKGLEYLLQLTEIPYRFQGFGAVVFVIAYTQYVYFYLNVYVALKYMDYSLIEAARGMGASKLRVFADVVWPEILPAVLTSVIVTFASGISSFSAPNLIGGGFKVLSTQIVRSKANNHMEIASVQVMLLFLISLSVMLLIQFYSKKYGNARSFRAASAGMGKKKGFFVFLCRIVIIVQIILVILPVIAIVYLSFVETKSIMTMIFPRGFTLENYLVIVEKGRVLKPIINSVKMSVMAVAAGLVLTVPAAYMIVRRGGRWNAVFKVLIMLPWVMPASVVAVNLINAFNHKSIFALNQSLIGGFYILPIAYTITSLPLLFSSNEVAVQGINKNLEEASRSLGADMFYTFVHVIVPNIAPGIMAGGVLGLIRNIGEYTMSALLYGVYNRPISISMVTNMQEYKMGISLAYGVIVIMICYVALGLIFKFDKERYF